MKTKELIEILKALPPDYTVVFSEYSRDDEDGNLVLRIPDGAEVITTDSKVKVVCIFKRG